jgi:hypothetical protein
MKKSQLVLMVFVIALALTALAGEAVAQTKPSPAAVAAFEQGYAHEKERV